ncbi:MAG TPA: type II toxin-antitoxin system Phd/YefM family antitoxin [Usitatibacter sp.]|nr:type II toxin-antitoxin system Phd/YefM family antitoxin [Usitatibacter sp.]
MKSIDIHEAKAHLSRLLDRVQAGEQIVIAKAGRPIARLVPIEVTHRSIRIGALKGRVKVPDSFNTMFGEEIAAMFGAAPQPSVRKRK